MAKQVIKDALWVDVGDYTVLRDGRIFKRKKNGKVREISQTKHKKGYMKFNCDGKTLWSHRFIAEAFISNPDNLPEINHKSEVRDQNDVLNLEFCDRSYNNNFGTHNERVGKALSKKLYQYALDGSFIREWPSTREVERQLGYANTNISKCCRGEYKTSYGYRWSYEPTI